MDSNSHLIDRITHIDWLANCGKPYLNRTRLKVQFISDWDRAVQSYHDPDWEDTTLKAQNALSQYLHDKWAKQYDDWNEIAKLGREFIKVVIEPDLMLVQERQALDKEFLDDVEWNLLGAILEDVYASCKLPRQFFGSLLDIYEDGHFPCG